MPNSLRRIATRLGLISLISALASGVAWFVAGVVGVLILDAFDLVLQVREIELLDADWREAIEDHE